MLNKAKAHTWTKQLEYCAAPCLSRAIIPKVTLQPLHLNMNFTEIKLIGSKPLRGK